ncbi:MAG: hypothetical protein RLY97_91 [Pseudomonadota bacterium]|jgi:hypothetical protein
MGELSVAPCLTRGWADFARRLAKTIFVRIRIVDINWSIVLKSMS